MLSQSGTLTNLANQMDRYSKSDQDYLQAMERDKENEHYESWSDYLNFVYMCNALICDNDANYLRLIQQSKNLNVDQQKLFLGPNSSVPYNPYKLEQPEICLYPKSLRKLAIERDATKCLAHMNNEPTLGTSRVAIDRP